MQRCSNPTALPLLQAHQTGMRGAPFLHRDLKHTSHGWNYTCIWWCLIGIPKYIYIILYHITPWYYMHITPYKRCLIWNRMSTMQAVSSHPLSDGWSVSSTFLVCGYPWRLWPAQRWFFGSKNRPQSWAPSLWEWTQQIPIWRIPDIKN